MSSVKRAGESLFKIAKTSFFPCFRPKVLSESLDPELDRLQAVLPPAILSQLHV